MGRVPYKILPLAVLSIFVLAIFSYSFAGIGSTAASFLRINPTTRSSSLGNTYTALSDDLESILMNPGGLYQIKSPQLSLLHMIYMEGASLEYAAFGMPLPNNLGVLAFRIEYLSSGDIVRNIELPTGMDYTTNGAFNTSELLGGVSYSVNFGNLGIGVNGNFLMETLDTVSDKGISLDAGIHYRLSDNFKVGASAQNISPGFMKLGNGNYPLIIRSGLVFGTKIEGYDVRLLADGVYDVEASKVRGGFGIEGDLFGIALARLGFEVGYDLGGFTAGIGYGFNAMGERLELNYAMVPRGDFGSTHKFSLTAKLGEKRLPPCFRKFGAATTGKFPAKRDLPVNTGTKLNTVVPENQESPVLKEAKPEVTAEQPVKKIRRIIRKKKAADGSTTYTTIYPDGLPGQQ